MGGGENSTAFTPVIDGLKKYPKMYETCDVYTDKEGN
jgi:hypothetical protein